MPFDRTRSAEIDELTGDEKYPLRLCDSNPVFQKIVLTFTLRFDFELDQRKLRRSLERLLKIDDWRQVGVRYKKNVSQIMNLHKVTSTW